jgi:hypothetical protein
MTPQVATQRIARNLFEVEAEIDRALASGATLLANVAQARLDMGTAASTGQLAMMRLTQALTALTAARKEMVQAHKELRKVGEERSDILFPGDCDPEGHATYEPALASFAA